MTVPATPPTPVTPAPGAPTPDAPRLRPAGPDAVLVELSGLAQVHALDARLRADPPPGVHDVVPAARTVLVRGDPRRRDRWAAAVVAAARDLDVVPTTGAGRDVELSVVYDGEDLDDVAAEVGLGVDEVIARHLAGGPDGYRVAFGGFLPGFAYVVGLDPRLHVPRRGSPRTRVPAGSVAVAGEHTAVYPVASPGGWRLLGRTDVVLLDLARPAADAALLRAGDVVRFVRAAPEPVRAAAPAPAPSTPPRAALAPPTPPGAALAPHPRPDPADPVALPLALTVVAPGPLTLVQDLGRPGLAAVGVPRSGAADPGAVLRAHRLVGNAPDAAVLETVLGGLVVRFGATTAFALVGAVLDATLDGVPVPVDVAVRAPAGSTLTLATPPDGLRTWLAVRGGLDVPRVLGSRSRDVLSGLGPAPLRAGDVLPYGAAYDGLPQVPHPADAAHDADGPGDADAPHLRPHPRPAVHPDPAPVADVVDLPAVDGPRLDLLDPAGVARLWGRVWQVTADSNRVAVRLDGPPLTRATDAELPSEGLVLGAVQVPHDGRPVLFGPDHPVTGGYPVVAVLTAAGVARAAQLRPGRRVRLVRA